MPRTRQSKANQANQVEATTEATVESTTEATTEATVEATVEAKAEAKAETNAEANAEAKAKAEAEAEATAKKEKQEKIARIMAEQREEFYRDLEYSAKILENDLNHGRCLTVGVDHLGVYQVHFDGDLFDKFSLVFKVLATNSEKKQNYQKVLTLKFKEFTLKSHSKHELKEDYFSYIFNDIEQYFGYFVEAIKDMRSHQKIDQILLVALKLISKMGITFIAINTADKNSKVKSGIQHGKVTAPMVLNAVLDVAFELHAKSTKVQGIMNHHIDVIRQLDQAGKLTDSLKAKFDRYNYVISQ